MSDFNPKNIWFLAILDFRRVWQQIMSNHTFLVSYVDGDPPSMAKVSQWAGLFEQWYCMAFTCSFPNHVLLEGGSQAKTRRVSFKSKWGYLVIFSLFILGDILKRNCIPHSKAASWPERKRNRAESQRAGRRKSQIRNHHHHHHHHHHRCRRLILHMHYHYNILCISLSSSFKFISSCYTCVPPPRAESTKSLVCFLKVLVNFP